MNKDNFTVMVVEDEKMLLEIIQRKLGDTGINVIGCESAENAIEILEKNEQPVDVIWLDYHLRGMNGLEFLNKIKKDTKLKNIPVIVVSNSANDSTASKIVEAGAVKYLVKAQNKMEDIINLMKTIIR